MLNAPPEEIGWCSARTATPLGAVYTVVDCHPCNRSGACWEESELGTGYMLVVCRECGGAQAYAVRVSP